MKFLPAVSSIKEKGNKGLIILIDPDKMGPKDALAQIERVLPAMPDFIFVGGSLLTRDTIAETIGLIKSLTNIPVILFPGSPNQVTDEADGILFLSLISGRNPDLLIGNHVVAAPLLRNMDLEVIPTGYMLIESGKTTTAHYMSGTLPIPADKPDIAACTALAGQYLGLKCIYMDAGSGALKPISSEMIKEVAKTISLPLIVGGGIRSIEDAERIYNAGADLIVVGNAAENPENAAFLYELSTLAQSLSKNVSV